jgi:hypothetical protein
MAGVVNALLHGDPPEGPAECLASTDSGLARPGRDWRDAARRSIGGRCWWREAGGSRRPRWLAVPKRLRCGGQVRGDTRGAQHAPRGAQQTAARPTRSLASARVPARRIRRRDSGTRFSIECSAQPAETGTPGRLQGTPGLRSVGWSRLSWRLRTIHRSASDSRVRSSASPSPLTLTCGCRTSDSGSPDVPKIAGDQRRSMQAANAMAGVLRRVCEAWTRSRTSSDDARSETLPDGGDGAGHPRAVAGQPRATS